MHFIKPFGTKFYLGSTYRRVLAPVNEKNGQRQAMSFKNKSSFGEICVVFIKVVILYGFSEGFGTNDYYM